MIESRHFADRQWQFTAVASGFWRRNSRTIRDSPLVLERTDRRRADISDVTRLQAAVCHHIHPTRNPCGIIIRNGIGQTGVSCAVCRSFRGQSANQSSTTGKRTSNVSLRVHKSRRAGHPRPLMVRTHLGPLSREPSVGASQGRGPPLCAAGPCLVCELAYVTIVRHQYGDPGFEKRRVEVDAAAGYD
jgi:hypothetical protein